MYSRIFSKYAIALIVIAAAIISTEAAATSGSFSPPSQSLNTISKDILEKLLDVQNNITMLNNALLSPTDSAKEQQTRLSALENQFQNLKKSFDDVLKNQDNNGQQNSDIARLTTFCNSLEKQMNKIQEEIRKKMENEDAARKPAAVIEAIKSRQFEKAESLLDSMNDDIKIPLMVHEIYGNNVANMQLLLELAKSMKTIQRSEAVLVSLWKEIKGSNDLNPQKLIELLEVMESEGIKQTKFSQEKFPTLYNAYNEAKEALKKNAGEMLKSAMLWDTYKKNVDVQKLANGLHDYDESVSDETMHRVIDDVYDRINKRQIADNIYSNTYVPQIAEALAYMYRKMKASNDLHDPAALKVAQYLSRALRMGGITSTSGQNLAAISSTVNSMPLSLRTLYFSQTLCMKNSGKSEYLYAAGGPHDLYSYDSDRRFIFTWTPGDMVTQGVWYVTNDIDSEDYYFKNRDHSNEFMYAAEVDFDDDYHQVFTWKHGGIISNGKSAWNLQLAGDEFLVKNKHNGEYLCVASDMHSNDRRYVFTSKKGRGVSNSKNCRWTFQPCQ